MQFPLTSTAAGARTVTATYTVASSAFVDSSDTEAYQVNAAATTISVSGPARSRINQPTTITFALSANAPGAGSPAGTVTLSSGASSCTVTVPTMTPSCALTFTALGSRTVSAASAPSNGNFPGSTSSGAGNAQTTDTVRNLGPRLDLATCGQAPASTGTAAAPFHDQTVLDENPSNFSLVCSPMINP